MACREIHSWTLCSMVGAYLDLALAYLLLCGSSIAFFTAKFLALLGLDLPCSCDGFFGLPHPPATRCLQGLLTHCPADKITSVRNSVLRRFPFDSIFNDRCETTPCCFDVKFVTDNSPRLLETHEVELSRSVSNGRLTLPSPGFESCSSSPSRSVLRRRRRTFAPRSAPSSRPKLLDSGAQLGISEGCSSSADFTTSPEDHLLGNCTDSLVEKDGGIADKDVDVSELSEVEVIKKLEKALEEEQNAYAALCLELEKERNAAASSADEAMAMIVRLQEEKAAIEMEARQYRRMSEEKSAYDEEEMDILKEIIVRREREKHVLEGELEVYRQMIVSDERFQSNLVGDCFDIVLPVEQKQLVDESFGKEEENDTPCIDKDWMGHGHWIDQSGLETECLDAMQVPTGSVFEGSSSGKGKSGDLGSVVPADVLCKLNIGNADHSCNVSTQTEIESSILDVHVIDDGKLETGYEKNRELGDTENILRNNNPRIESSGSSNADCLNVHPSTKWRVPEGIHRSSSESEMVTQMTNSPPDSTPHKLKSSKSSVDSERIKLEIEVELLRKRLRTVQQGREKLSIERREKEDFQLQLLEEISSQLREIRKATEPVKGARRASLPPQFSKA
ncbi:GTD-binding domain-containing protein [Dioscorea alata]|uniref:GTD-binding domain-containing protein n=1 Tax=Dioscorea alata TaxID=55571 RepID=A0ACB7W5P9_DIOAL|nr:GTD-binding domain-containing protein [Dioscorea alata]